MSVSMHSALQHFITGFWLSAVAFVISCSIAFLATRRRQLWLRVLDAGDSFLMHLGFSKRVATFGRGFSESRGYAVSMVVFAGLSLLFAILNGIGYFYVCHLVR